MSDILFLAHRIPYPPDRGDKIRSWHILKHLTGLARVHVACFADDEADAAHLPALRTALGGALGEAHVEVRRTGKAVAGTRALARGKPVSLTLFDSAGLRAFVDRLLATGRIGAIFAFSGQMAQFVPSDCPARFVMDFVDMDSAKFAQYANDASGPMRWVHRREAEKLFAFERATAARADLSLFVSEAEAALFRSRTGLADIRALSNGIDLAFFDPAAAFPRLVAAERGEGPVLLFTGQMDYAPNVDAVGWFVREVLPHIPGRFVIAGRNPAAEVRALAGARVHVTGAVPDIRTWLAAADLVVAPLRIARGIQNKVLEAMAMAKPVVATRAAFEGIEAEPGRDLVVADGAAAMADAIRGLLHDEPRCAALGAAARQRVEIGYGWERRLAPLVEMVAPPAGKAAA
ncbi:TIGR03087 family PEP-CTERM/XrtA system glycosyltransferase [Sphingosinicella sp. LHD-64]|uniref:TIGR03087 family PEP-CTERM/XrtA system glycosyltransferase n=1 Tax=Sphingosinicella sp. LHD-64 TaxID=3072139 RepID=UPI00280C6A9C|nr:TIGR03087 family PEP-CTERM/XrtA system glycosyltransferase [Sphingosinicella sp. LHD-64]MDQ8754688.1 TIGR03087 family PEP-CTERM/XrtA system glycosyltransferase [Sphingosinicella sp. LHD-64]